MQTVLLDRARRLVSLVRLAPFETTTVEGQSRERHRRIILATVASGLAKGVSVLASLVIVPMTLHYLGKERAALWAMISSLFIGLTCVDFGIGNGLLNLIATAHGKDDKKTIKECVSSGFFLLLSVGLLLAIVVVLGCIFIPMAKVFPVTSAPAIHEVACAVAVLGIFLGLGMPTMVVLRFQEGLQEGFNTYLAQMFGNILALVFALIVVHLKLGLPWLVLALLGGPFVANVGGFAFQFYVFKKWAQPAWKDCASDTSRALIKTGLIFFALNILTILGFQQADTFIIPHVLGDVRGPSEVTAYWVVQRLSQASFLCWALTQALWPAYAEAIARNDLGWVRQTIRRSLKFSLVCGVTLGLGLYFFGMPVIKFWARTPFSPSLIQPLLLSFAFYILVYGVVLTLAVVINGAHLLKEQLVFLVFSTSAALILKIVLCKAMGAAGVVWATNIAFTLFFILPAFLLIRKRYGSF
jgi:O-antigen/teichoic acid export membrane protein